MSIDARIQSVRINEDGSGELRLIDRPAKSGTPGIAGQRVLSFATAPEEVTALNGLDIWGGDSMLMLGHELIAERTSCTGIVFVDGELFKKRVAAYRTKAD